MKNVISKIINSVFALFPINTKKIVFQSGRSKTDSNPYAIYKYLKDKSISDYKLIWLIDKNTDLSLIDTKEAFYYKSIRGLYELATAKYWIRSQSIGGVIKKRKKQVYIQTWHGAGALKRCGYDIENTLKCRPPLEHVKEWDYLITTDKYNNKAMVDSTGYNKETLMIGNPVTDLLLNSSTDTIKKIKSKLGIDESKKVILYAPTFRDYDLENYSGEYEIPLEVFRNISSEFLVILRLHPWISNQIKELNLPKNIVNMGDYPIIEDLMLISDILISDYSSIVFEYSVLKKPIIYFPFDYDKYTEVRGGFYIDYSSLPGPICYNKSELIDEINQIDNIEKKYKDKINEFNDKYNYLNDGKVCKRFVDLLKQGKIL